VGDKYIQGGDRCGGSVGRDTSYALLFEPQGHLDKHTAETGDVPNAMDEKRTQVPPESPPTGEC